MMDDGSTQIFQYQYNAIGKVTQEIDPVGRETDYTYATNNIDLLTVTQKNGGSNEERDGSNLVTKRYFSQGEQRITGSTTVNFYYTRDHLGSIREMLDTSGAIQARYSYDPFGRSTKVSGSLDCDFQYAGMYYHAASGLNLTMFRAYNPNTGTWLSRDPLGESQGANLYAYCKATAVEWAQIALFGIGDLLIMLPTALYLLKVRSGPRLLI